MVAFTKQNAGRFHIGVMRTDGSEERLLTASFLDEGPTWAPNGRVIMFTRETPGAAGGGAAFSVDITGPEPACGADGRCGVRPGMVAACCLKRRGFPIRTTE